MPGMSLLDYKTVFSQELIIWAKDLSSGLVYVLARRMY